MKLENYEVHLPNYSIGDAIYDKIGPVCESYGKTVLVIGGILLNGKYLFVDNQKGLCYRDRYFYKVTDVDLIVTLIILN